MTLTRSWDDDDDNNDEIVVINEAKSGKKSCMGWWSGERKKVVTFRGKLFRSVSCTRYYVHYQSNQRLNLVRGMMDKNTNNSNIGESSGINNVGNWINPSPPTTIMHSNWLHRTFQMAGFN